MDTPEFLIWAIEHTCPIRGTQNGSDPERTERQLRAARAVSDARREGRVFEGLCVHPPNGFRIDDALAVYGGLLAVEAACGGCPANALGPGQPAALAGCFGIVPLPVDPRPVHAAIELAAAKAAVVRRLATQPRWYGLWIESPLADQGLQEVGRVLESAEVQDHACRRALAEMMTGLEAAHREKTRLHVRLFPRGCVQDGEWRLVAHCQRCKAEWGSAGSRQCAVCGYVGGPAAEQKRKARGQRPYFPLERLLGERQAAEFLLRYAVFRARQGSPDQAQNRPPRGPPNSPPAG
jgi:hypothetical protein